MVAQVKKPSDPDCRVAGLRVVESAGAFRMAGSGGDRFGVPEGYSSGQRGQTVNLLAMPT